MAVRGGQVKSLGALRKSIKRSSQGGAIAWVPKEKPLIVRFIEEPDRWFEFFTHYDQANKKSGICTGTDCAFCADDVQTSKRILANAVDTDSSRVIALGMPTSLVKILLKRYDKYGTLLDRNYELVREGEGLDTEYDAEAESPSKFNFGVYEPLDLQDVLETEAGGGDDEEEEDDFLPPKRPLAKKAGGVRRTRVVEDEDDDEPAPRRRTLAKKAAPPVKRTLPKRTLRK